MDTAGPAIPAYKTKDIALQFRGADFSFALSQGLFSSAGVDVGTGFLLKVLSKTLDQGDFRPRTILDAGSGTGILGICAARALSGLGLDVHCRAQDRDELARLFTEYNARQNSLGPAALEAYTEPLLGGPVGARWGLILSNLPAKAGKLVLLDFIARSAALLEDGGRVLIVAVEPLAELVRGRIGELRLPLLREEAAGGYRVFIYGPWTDGPGEPVVLGDRFLERYPAYRRVSGTHEMEDIPYGIDAFQGAAGFDNPGEAVRGAAKLTVKIASALTAALSPTGTGTVPALLIHEEGQGHFPAWLSRYTGKLSAGGNFFWTLFGRNILSLEAARHNLAAVSPRLVPAVDAALYARTAGESCRFIVLFPEAVPQTSRISAHWDGILSLLEPGGIALAAFPSSEAERFDSKKPKGFRRLAEIRRRGFRALAYEKTP
jgi:hypothetical protein